jgi:hypothetical protein
MTLVPGDLSSVFPVLQPFSPTARAPVPMVICFKKFLRLVDSKFFMFLLIILCSS